MLSVIFILFLGKFTKAFQIIQSVDIIFKFLSRKIQCLACNENTTSNVGERNPKLLPFVDKQPEPARGDLK